MGWTMVIMQKGTGMHRAATLVGTGLILLAGCTSAKGAAGNGTVYVSKWGANQLEITGLPVNADGTVGAAVEVLTEDADETKFPGVVDGRGDLVLIGRFSDYWTTQVVLRRGADVVRDVAAPRWCGGEGLIYNVCALLDDTRLARTTELGGEDTSEGSVLVSSLETGADLARFGPYEHLSMVLPTQSPDQLVLIAGLEGGPSQVSRLDLAKGTSTKLGTSPDGWTPLCAIGSDSVLGFNSEGTPTAAVVGPAPAAKFEWDTQDSVVGCSADGRFLYLQRIPEPPTEDANDTEPPNPPTKLERIAVSDGMRSQVAALDPGLVAGPVTR